MSVYSNFIATESSNLSDIPSVIPDINAESLFYDESVEPCEDNFLVAGARICAENTINMNSIMEACAIGEFCYLEETGTELNYAINEASAAGFFEKAKQFFLKLWEKIKSIFKKAIMLFNSKAKSDKDFYNKYKKDLTAASNKDYGDKEISMYKYIFYGNLSGLAKFNRAEGQKAGNTSFFTGSDSDIIGAICKIAKCDDIASLLEGTGKIEKNDEDKIKKSITTINESDWKTDYYDTVRADILNSFPDVSYSENTCSASEFSKEIAEVCQGDSSKEDVPLREALSSVLPYLQKSGDIVKYIDGWLKSWKKDIDNEVRSLEKTQRQFLKDISKEESDENRRKNWKHTVYSAAIILDKETKNIGITFHSNVINQLKAASGQAKSICLQAVSYKKPKNESSVYTTEGFESGNSLLDNMELI